MKREEIHKIMEDVACMKKTIGTARMNLNAGWNTMVDNNLQDLNRQLTSMLERVILDKMIEYFKQPIVEDD